MNTSIVTNSYSRHMRLVAGLIAALVAVTGHAGEKAPAYTMTVINDAYYGNEVLGGDYRTAIDRIRAKGDRALRSFEAKTNLCVAYAKSGDVERAVSVCDAAVETARTRAGRAERNPPAYAEANWREYEALALSNRGVVHALIGEEKLAHRDFSRAVKLGKRIDAPGENLARLSAASTM